MVRVLIACILVGVAAIILTAACTGMLAGKAEARANIQDYFKGPNDFYPARHDIEGPTKLVIDTIGWNATRIDGNLGIGNGSTSTFDLTSTRDVEYPENGFMCGDVSTQPWVPGRENIAENVASESKEYDGNATVNATESAPETRSFPGFKVTGQNLTGNISRLIANRTEDPADGNAIGNVSRPATNRTTGEENRNATEAADQARAAGENLTYAAYHPIQYLNPVRDVLYEHPLATPGTAYCELLGFETPSGDLVNVGMKCTGYGY